jgi:hypothetical protein
MDNFCEFCEDAPPEGSVLKDVTYCWYGDDKHPKRRKLCTYCIEHGGKSGLRILEVHES